MDGKIKHELSSEEIGGRGRRLAEAMGLIEKKREEKKSLTKDLNAEIQALTQETMELSQAIREGFEWRDEASQENLGLDGAAAAGNGRKKKRGARK